MRDRINRALLGVLAAVVALAFAAGVTSIVLAITHHNPWDTFKQLYDYGTKADQIAVIVNQATTYYLSAIAVAIGFRMNLFNIGVDGQYQLAAIVAAAFGGEVVLPAGLHQIAIIVVAMLTGSLWAGLVGVLKATRGVSEVISTIMMNAVAGAIIAYLIRPSHFCRVTTSPPNRSTSPARSRASTSFPGRTQRSTAWCSSRSRSASDSSC